MFTGIVENQAEIAVIEKKDHFLSLGIAFPPTSCEGLKIGASLAINGVCLTAVRQENHLVYFDVIEETLTRTTLASVNLGDKVNFERSARYGDEIGGHLLSGHVFCTACLTAIEGNIYTFTAPSSAMKYLFPKGYIALDGVSLTLVDINLQKNTFTVHLIPETLRRTTLGRKKEGSFVNVEIDSLSLAVVETIERSSITNSPYAKNHS